LYDLVGCVLTRFVRLGDRDSVTLRRVASLDS
jgi:hypothetical protein